jgi:HEAT repeat protein
MKSALPITFVMAALVALFGLGCDSAPKLGYGDVNIQEQIQRLGSSDPSERTDGAAKLGLAAASGAEASAAVPALTDALKDSESQVRRLAAYALMEIGPKAKASVPALQEALSRARDIDERYQIIHAIKAIDPEAGKPLTEPSSV